MSAAGRAATRGCSRLWRRLLLTDDEPAEAGCSQKWPPYPSYLAARPQGLDNF